MLAHSLIVAMVTAVAMQGQVRDARTHREITFASVELLKSQTPVEQQHTDGEGRFLFAHLTEGQYTIFVACSGYEPYTIQVEVHETAFPIVIELLRKKTPSGNGPQIVSLRGYLVPKTARKEFDRARKDVRREDCSTAITHFENGLRIFDQDASAHNELGNCYRKLGQLDRAEDSFNRARALSDSIYVCLNLAEVYAVQRRFKEAEDVILEALRKRPNAGDAYYGLALIYLEQGLLERAEAAAVEADRHSHQIADLHLVLAEIYWREQKSAEAFRQLESYLKEAPNGRQNGPVRQVLKRQKRELK